MHNKDKAVKKTVMWLLAIVALAAGSYTAQLIYSQKAPKAIDRSLFHGTLLEKPRQINNFNLTGLDQDSFTNASLSGKWTLVFFGFTSCGYVCPTTMAELGKSYRILEQQGAKILPNVVMITLDPERDSIDKLGSYVKAFDKHFYGARGDQQQIRSLTKDLGVAYAKISQKDGAKNQDDIEHTGAIMLFNPRGELTAFFTSPHSAKNIASDFSLLTS
ncbi:MAG: SCO family protein [Legionellaceae bacterium]|nr:SCO family protein [Legionellaceae bacterium]